MEEEEGRKFAASKDLEYFECSAVSYMHDCCSPNMFHCVIFLFLHSQKEHDNVEKPFLYLAEQFYKIYSDKVAMET